MATDAANVVEKECSEPERKTHSSDGPACADDKHGADAVVDPPVPASADTKPTRQRAPRAKKVAVANPPVRSEIDVHDPLFFAGLNILHKRLEADSRRTRFASMPIA